MLAVTGACLGWGTSSKSRVTCVSHVFDFSKHLWKHWLTRHVWHRLGSQLEYRVLGLISNRYIPISFILHMCISIHAYILIRIHLNLCVCSYVCVGWLDSMRCVQVQDVGAEAAGVWVACRQGPSAPTPPPAFHDHLQFIPIFVSSFFFKFLYFPFFFPPSGGVGGF